MTKSLSGLRSFHRVMRAYVVALWWAARVEVGLRTTPVAELAESLGAPLDTADADREPPREATAGDFTRRQWTRVVAIDRLYRRWPFGDTCLRRSLVWGHTLRGRQPALRIGVARDNEGAVIAHSWLEFDDVSLGLDPDTEFLPLMGGGS